MQPTPSATGDAEPGPSDLSGRCVGSSYMLVAPVGQGATGTVWRAIETGTGGYVAVKLLHDSLVRQPKLVTRFVRERSILTMMRHEHIVGVRDLFSVGESLALVMDFVAGGSLRERLTAAGTLPPADAAALLAQVAAALAHAHELGVVHRDVKPDNILLEPGGERIRLTDFGIARVIDAAGLTTPHAVMGTPHYMAPEAASGDAGPASDVYALGITLYELVSGRPPYAGEPLAVLWQHLDEPPPRPDGLPETVWDLLGWCLMKDPRRRPSASELAIALRDLARLTAGIPALPPLSEPIDDVRPGKARRRPRNGPRSWKWRRPGLVVILLAGLLGVPVVWHDMDRTGSSPAPGGGVGGRADGPAPQESPAAIARPDYPRTPAFVPYVGSSAAPPGPAPAAAHDARPPIPRLPSATTEQPSVRTSNTPEYGPYRCGDVYSIDLGHPVLVKPCQSTGPAIRATGWMEALPGVQADISLTVRDAVSDDVVAGPYTCPGVTFTSDVPERTCGPVDLQAPPGGRYRVAESWVYTASSLLPGGVTRGPSFDY